MTSIEDFDERDPILINDLAFPEVSCEIEKTVLGLREIIDVLSDFCAQHARLIALDIEPENEFLDEAEIPKLSVRISERSRDVRAEWQRNKPIFDWSGHVVSIERSVIRMNGSRFRYPSYIFKSVTGSEFERLKAAEVSLSKIRRQFSLLSDMRRLIDQFEYASKGVSAPLDRIACDPPLEDGGLQRVTES